MTGRRGGRCKSHGRLEDHAGTDHDNTIGLESLNSTILAGPSRCKRATVESECEAGRNKIAEVDYVSAALLAFWGIQEKNKLVAEEKEKIEYREWKGESVPS